MIANLDHVVVLVRDIEAATANYKTLMGCEPSWRGGRDDVSTAIFTLANMSLELMAPSGEGEAATRVRSALDERGEGPASIAFAVDDVAAAHHRLLRVGLRPEDIVDGESRDTVSGESMSWKRTRASKSRTHGIGLFFLQRPAPLKHSVVVTPAPVVALDSLVIATPDPDRAAALYCAPLGLRLALDRTVEALGTRFIFASGSHFVVEIIHRVKEGRGDGPDKIWGLSWRVGDVEATRARLMSDRVEVSDIREGRKPGTRVFTVKSGTCGVPTLMIQQGERTEKPSQER